MPLAMRRKRHHAEPGPPPRARERAAASVDFLSKPSAKRSATSTALRLSASFSRGQTRRQHATASSRIFRSLALPRRNSSIGAGSLQASHSASVIGVALHPPMLHDRRRRGEPPATETRPMPCRRRGRHHSAPSGGTATGCRRTSLACWWPSAGRHPPRRPAGNWDKSDFRPGCGARRDVRLSVRHLLRLLGLVKTGTPLRLRQPQ
jgi:hypothetical protein